MSDSSALRRAAVVVTGAPDRLAESAIHRSTAVAKRYGLGRRVLALVLGVRLPLPHGAASSPPAPARPTASDPAGVGKDKRKDTRPGRDEEAARAFQRLLDVLRGYVLADPAERLRQRPQALEYLKDLNGLVRITKLESRLGHRPELVVRYHDRVEGACPAGSLSSLQKYQPFMLDMHRDALNHLCNSRGNHLRRRAHGPRQLLRRVRSSTGDPAEVLYRLGTHTDDPDQLFYEWRRHLPVEPEHLDPSDRDDPAEILERAGGDDRAPDLPKLEDVRDALALASHDFTDEDLSGADLTDVPLRGVYWSTTTQWPESWQAQIAKASERVDATTLRVSENAVRED
ncbi:hypothetical protein [Actinophytocola xanthii]|uniref:Uncharacterized protein n=1 Tax=Actinophytocola xanthii TaxID=1912961 RepID=A0A1Q8CUY5_9PSEU|nr:hypothetical protein [Actinophytocola xanthii]OLF18146.1 hypothetical protein BU204_08445 [Actinophytocola xanthii]